MEFSEPLKQTTTHNHLKSSASNQNHPPKVICNYPKPSATTRHNKTIRNHLKPPKNSQKLPGRSCNWSKVSHVYLIASTYYHN